MAAPKEYNINEDLVKLQAALPVLPKDTSNPFFKSKYTSLDTITEVVFPIMTKYNFAWVTMPSFNEAGEPSLKYELRHLSGEAIGGEMKLLLNKQDPQGQGSAITYARRYAITSVLGLVSDEDDDGNAARQAAEKARTVDPLPPEEPSIEIHQDVEAEAHKKALAEVMTAIKAKGAKDKSQAIQALNDIAEVPDFSKLTSSGLQKLKTKVTTTPKSVIEAFFIEVPFE